MLMTRYDIRSLLLFGIVLHTLTTSACSKKTHKSPSDTASDQSDSSPSPLSPADQQTHQANTNHSLPELISGVRTNLDTPDSTTTDQASSQQSSDATSKPSFAATGLDASAYRDSLIKLVRLYDGGLDGQSGAGVFRDGFNGYFNVNLNQYWQPFGGDSTSAVAKSRWVFVNATAYQADPSSSEDY